MRKNRDLKVEIEEKNQVDDSGLLFFLKNKKYYASKEIKENILFRKQIHFKRKISLTSKRFVLTNLQSLYIP